MPRRIKNRIPGAHPNIGLYILIIIICLISFFPFYWLINTSLQSKASMFAIPPQLFPEVNPVTAYVDYVKTSDIGIWMGNTLLVGIVSVTVSTMLGLPAAYAISRFRFKARTLYTFMILFTQMMSATFLCIPIYMMFTYANIINTRATLMILYSCTTLPISIWFAKGFFDSLPLGIEEAARVDGANTMQILFRILIPLIRPGIIATATWVFIVAWDEYLYAYTLINNTKLWTNSVGLASYIGQFGIQWNEIMSGAVIVTLPVVLLFSYFQKFIVSGLTSGAVKA